MFEFYGYNNGKAIAIKNRHNLQVGACISIIPCVVITIFAFLYNIYLLFFWLLPLFLFALSFFVSLFEKYDTEVFLQGLKQKHKFKIDNKKLIKDGKEVKSTRFIKVREYKKFIFLELKQSYYVIYKNELNCDDKALITEIKEIKGTK